MKRFLLICSINLGVLYCLFLVNQSFFGAEQHEYMCYINSVVYEGDLNIVDNYAGDVNYYGISQTYNLADFHQHGGTIIWVPFFLTGKFFQDLFLRLSDMPWEIDPYAFPELLTSLSSFLLAILTLVLAYRLFKDFYGKKATFLALITVVFGIPFLLYSIYRPGQANSIALFFGTLLIYQLFTLSKTSGFLPFLFSGLLFSLCYVIKIDLWFHAFTIALWFLYLFFRDKDLKLAVKRSLFFAAGFIPVFIFRTINSYLMYGTLGSSEAKTINAGYSIFPDYLFSPYRGMFFISPILFFCLAGCIYSLWIIVRQIQKKHAGQDAPEKEKITRGNFELRILMACFFVAFLVKTVVRGTGFAWGGGSFGRVFLTELPLFVFLIAEFITFCTVLLRGQEKKIYLVYLAFVPFCLWTFVNSILFHYLEPFSTNIDDYLSLWGGLFANDAPIHWINTAFIEQLNFIQEKLAVVIILGLAISLSYIIWDKWIQKYLLKNRTLNFIHIFILMCTFIYGLISTSNMVFNKDNVERLKEEGFFADRRVSHPAEFAAGENMGSMHEMLSVYRTQQNEEKVRQIEATLSAYEQMLQRTREDYPGRE